MRNLLIATILFGAGLVSLPSPVQAQWGYCGPNCQERREIRREERHERWREERREERAREHYWEHGRWWYR